MSTARTVPAGNGVAWLTRAFSTVRRHPGPLGLAIFLLVIAILVPVCVQLAGQLLMPGTTAGMAVQVLAGLTMVIVASLMMVGVLRLIHSLETHGSGSATSIFETFGDTDLMLRAVVFALIVLVVSIAFIAVLLLAMGPDMLAWYGRLIVAPLEAGAAAPPITRSPWLAAAIGLFGGLALFGVNTFGYAQVALTRRSGTEAFMDGLEGTARNVLPILLNIVVVIAAILLITMPMLLLMMLAGFLGGLVHPVAAIALVVPFYIAYMLALYAVIFATMYHAWRDVFGDPAPIPIASPPAPASELSA